MPIVSPEVHKTLPPYRREIVPQANASGQLNHGILYLPQDSSNEYVNRLVTLLTDRTIESVSKPISQSIQFDSLVQGHRNIRVIESLDVPIVAKRVDWSPQISKRNRVKEWIREMTVVFLAK